MGRFGRILIRAMAGLWGNLPTRKVLFSFLFYESRSLYFRIEITLNCIPLSDRNQWYETTNLVRKCGLEFAVHVAF